MASGRMQRRDRKAPANNAGARQSERTSAAQADEESIHDLHDVHDSHDSHDSRTLYALQSLTDTALSHLPLEAMLEELLDRVQVVMNVDNVAILLLDERTNELEVYTAHGPEEEVVGRVRIPLGEGFAGRIAAERKPLLVEDVTVYPVKNALLRERLHTVLGAPLLAGDRVLGVVHVGNILQRHFTRADTALLEQVADRIARAIERAQLLAEAQEARREAEQRAAFLRATFDALGDGLVIVDTTGRRLFSNPAYTGLLSGASGVSDASEAESDRREARASSGVSEQNEQNVRSEDEAGEAADWADAGWLHTLDVRDEHGKPLLAHELGIARALRGERLSGANALDFTIRRPGHPDHPDHQDRQDTYVSVSSAPVRDTAGELIGAVMAVRDVTERRTLERQAQERAERLQAIFSSVADGLFVYDAEGRIAERNPAASTLLEAIAREEWRELSVYECGRRIVGGIRDTAGQRLPVEQWPEARIARGESLSGQSSVDIRVRRLDGQDTILNVSGAPLRDERGAIVGSVCLYRDVTERWELHEVLRQRTSDLEAANARLRTLVEVLPVGVAIVDEAGKPLLINESIREVWGPNLPMSENMAGYVKYRGWRVDTGESVAADDWGLSQALVHGAVSVNTEYDIETFDGRHKTILESAAPLRDESGRISGAVSVIFDITERKRQAQRTRDALEAFIALTSTLVEGLSGEEEDAAARASVALERQGEGDGVERLPDRNPTARRLAEMTRKLLGCSRVVVSTVEDVDGQLLQHPLVIVGLRPEQERMWWAEHNAAQARVVGAGLLPEDRERLLRGEVVTVDLTRPPYEIPNSYGATAVLAAVMGTQGSIVGMLALDFDDDGRRPHSFTPEEIEIATGVARLGAVALQRERLLREREAAQAEALALTEASRRMDEFLSIAGHELRTPITTVKANLQLAERRARRILEESREEERRSALEQTKQSPQVDGTERTEREARPAAQKVIQQEQLMQMLERATAAVERQERLLRDLLDISRIAVGRLEFRVERHNLVDLARDAVEEQRLLEPDRLIEMETPLNAGESLTVDVDADRIGQVFTNLLNNALKYSASEQPVALVVLRSGSRARVEVRDTGPGLSPEQQERLFERFYRAAGIDVMSGAGVGLGLGLHISKTIIEYHGGTIGVESEQGKGSTFWFELPLATMS